MTKYSDITLYRDICGRITLRPHSVKADWWLSREWPNDLDRDLTDAEALAFASGAAAAGFNIRFVEAY